MVDQTASVCTLSKDRKVLSLNSSIYSYPLDHALSPGAKMNSRNTRKLIRTPLNLKKKKRKVPIPI